MPLKIGNGSISAIKVGATDIAKIYRGSELVYQKSRLPEAYTASEYLQSSGTQYIDTGVIANQDTKLTMDMEFLNEINEESPFGAYETASKFQWHFSFFNYSYPMFGNSTTDTVHDLRVDTKYLLELSGNGAYINGTLVKTYSAQTFQMTGSINLFRRNPISGTTLPRMATIKMYGCKIYQGDILAHEYLPAVRNSDSVAGLYDTITGAFLTNVGTGDFETTVGVASGKSIEFNTSSKALSGWQVKGDTEQDGTPTPTAPVEVKNVTGRNTVSVVGKNLLNKYKSVNGSIPSGSTSETLNASNLSITSEWFSVKPNTTYRVSGENDRSRWQLKNGAGVITNLGDKSTITTASDTVSARVYYWWSDDNVPVSPTDKNVQVEQGSTATSYEAYSGQEVEVNLGKNIFDIATSQEYKWFGDTGIMYGSADPNVVSDFIPVRVGETYTISGSLGSLTNKVASYNNDKSFKTLLVKNNTTRTFVADAPFIRVAIGGGNAIAIKNTIQLELGSTPTEYAPYFTPIELCKLGDYQDRIYKDGNSWKLEKKVGKAVIDGSENWSQTGTYPLFVANIFDKLETFSTPPTPDGSIKSNLWSQNTVALGDNTIGFRILVDTNVTNLRVREAVMPTLADFKSRLANNNALVYAPLKTPVITDITDPTLIAQLNELEKLNANIGYNLVETSGSVLAPYIEFKYKKQ